MIFNKYSYLLFFITATIFSCNLDDSNSPSTEALLTTEDGWQLSLYTTDLDDKAENISAQLFGIDNSISQEDYQAAILAEAQNLESVIDCERDEVYFFAESGDLNITVGNNDCGNNGTGALFGEETTWDFKNDERTQVAITNNGTEVTYNIELITPTTLVLGGNLPYVYNNIISGSNFDFTITFDRKF